MGGEHGIYRRCRECGWLFWVRASAEDDEAPADVCARCREALADQARADNEEISKPE